MMNDVVSIDLARKLKKMGCPQESRAYWKAEIPSLSSSSGIIKDGKGKIGWRLVLEKPLEQPYASAYTYEELLKILIKFKVEMPVIKEENQIFIGSYQGQDLFFERTKQDILARAFLK